MLLDAIKSYRLSNLRKDQYPPEAQRPAPISGAAWQAGVSAGNSQLRPYIDGEPEPLCFAANPRLGWAMRYVRASVGPPLADVSIVASPAISDFLLYEGGRPAVETVFGRVELRPCPNE